MNEILFDTEHNYFFLGPVYEVMKKCDKVTKKENNFVIFPTVHDAVLFALANDIQKKGT